MSNSIQEVLTTFRLVVDTDNGMTSCAYPFANIDAAVSAAPSLNRSRFARGRHPYSAVAEFSGDTCVAVVPLKDLQ